MTRNVRVDGDEAAPVVLFSHALGADLHLWDAQAEALAAGFRVVRYDIAGHGGSSARAGAYTFDELAADALEVLDELGIARAHLVGAALGSSIAIALAAAHPQRVGRLVLANAAARAGSAAAWNERIALVEADGMEAVADFVLPRFFTPRFRSERPDVVRRVRATVAATDPAGYIGCCTALRDGDLTNCLAAITVPALVLSATHDSLTTPADGRALHGAIANSRYVELDAAHLACVEAAPAFTAATAAFLAAG